MATNTLQPAAQMLTALLRPWHNAVEDPLKAQQEVLDRLLKNYAQTDYGAQHGASQIETIADYRRAFPVATYEQYKPLIERVMAGEVSLLPPANTATASRSTPEASPPCRASNPGATRGSPRPRRGVQIPPRILS